jgi:hypothetical protein
LEFVPLVNHLERSAVDYHRHAKIAASDWERNDIVSRFQELFTATAAQKVLVVIGHIDLIFHESRYTSATTAAI